MRLVVAIFVTLVVNSFASADQSDFYGVWGTNKQCAKELIVAGGSKHAAPFEITKDWLGHGDVWCRLFWVNTGSGQHGRFALARALCGEDDVRDYQLDLTLKNAELTLTWNRQITNNSLQRCTH
jgi:hypothetical protein